MSLFTPQDFESAVEIHPLGDTVEEIVDIIAHHEGAKPAKIVLTCDLLEDKGGYEGYIYLAYVGPTLMTYFVLTNEVSEWWYADFSVDISLIGRLRSKAIGLKSQQYETVQTLRLCLLERHNQKASNFENIIEWMTLKANERYEQVVLPRVKLSTPAAVA